jgi:hypothetical protein
MVTRVPVNWSLACARAARSAGAELQDPASGNDDPVASGNVHQSNGRSNSSCNRGRAGFADMTGRTDVSIIASEQPAIGSVEPVDAARSAIIPAAVFIIVEIILVAETISVILLKEFDPRNPGAAPIAVLLSIALLANLGLVCSIAAASVAKSVPRSEYEEGPPLSGWSAAAGLGGDGIESAPSDGHARHAR